MDFQGTLCNCKIQRVTRFTRLPAQWVGVMPLYMYHTSGSLVGRAAVSSAEGSGIKR